MEVRAAVPADREEVIRLLALAARESGERVRTKAQSAQVDAALAGTISLGFLVAAEAGRLLGMLSVATAPTTLMAGAFGFVDDVFVESAARGQGVATALLAAARDRGAREGLVELRLAAPGHDARLARLYERAGFQSAARWMVLSLTRDWAAKP